MTYGRKGAGEDSGTNQVPVDDIQGDSTGSNFYGSEIWVVIDSIMTILEVFYHRVTIWIPVITACRGDSGEW